MGRTGVTASGSSHFRAMFEAAASTDRLIELILEEDRDVLKELLTTQEIVISGKDRTYFNRRLTKEERAAANKDEDDQKKEEKPTKEEAVKAE